MSDAAYHRAYRAKRRAAGRIVKRARTYVRSPLQMERMNQLRNARRAKDRAAYRIDLYPITTDRRRGELHGDMGGALTWALREHRLRHSSCTDEQMEDGYDAE